MYKYIAQIKTKKRKKWRTDKQINLSVKNRLSYSIFTCSCSFEMFGVDNDWPGYIKTKNIFIIKIQYLNHTWDNNLVIWIVRIAPANVRQGTHVFK